MRAPLLGMVALAASLAASLAACGPKTIDIEVNVVDTACAGNSPLTNVDTFQVKVSGPGILPDLVTVSSANTRSASVPHIPAGKARVIEVRAYHGDPQSGGTVVGLGRSLPFDVPNVATAQSTVNVNVFLRPVGYFTRPASASAPGTCLSMLSPRAGHTATLLQDGRVFIAGGFQLDGGVETTLDSAEIYDPSTGTFSKAPDIQVLSTSNTLSPLPRAFHAATLLTSGQVLMSGGDIAEAGEVFPSQAAVAYDPSSNSYFSVPMQSPRSHHQAAIDNAGRVVLVGGVTTPGLGYDGGTMLDTVEWFDPSTWAQGSSSYSQVASFSLPRLGAAVSAVNGGQYIAVAGGYDGTQVQGVVNFLTYSGNTYTLDSQRLLLNTARMQAAAVPFEDANHVLFSGGFSQVGTDPTNPTGPVATSEILGTATSFTVGSPVTGSPRGDICSVALLDGRVLTIGGRTASGSDDTVELITPSQSGGATLLAQPSLASVNLTNPQPESRYFHTCTTLTDGSVLILGGVNDQGGTQTILQDALIYMPQPLN